MTGSESGEAAVGRRASAPATPALRRFATAVAGFSVLLLGVALLVIPIPGTTVVVIPLGLTILAREFSWARRLRDWSADRLHLVWVGLRRSSAARSVTPAAAHRS